MFKESTQCQYAHLNLHLCCIEITKCAALRSSTKKSHSWNNYDTLYLLTFYIFSFMKRVRSRFTIILIRIYQHMMKITSSTVREEYLKSSFRRFHVQFKSGSSSAINSTSNSKQEILQLKLLFFVKLKVEQFLLKYKWTLTILHSASEMYSKKSNGYEHEVEVAGSPVSETKCVNCFMFPCSWVKNEFETNIIRVFITTHQCRPVCCVLTSNLLLKLKITV